MSVSVIIQGSDSISAFDIILKANHTIIKPADANTAGSILSGGTIISKCIGNVLKAGNACSPNDSVDTIHMGAVGPAGFLTIAPTTGLLFTAVYNVTGTTMTPISFQTGCSSSSVNGTTTCVLFSNGSISPPLETIQGASYTAAPSPTFSMSSSRPEITLGKSETSNATITLTSLNGFMNTITFSITSSPSVRHPPSFSTSPTSVSLAAGSSSTTFFGVSVNSNTAKTTYNVILTATGGGVSATVQIPVTVIP